MSAGLDTEQRLERYARQAFARATSGHWCDLVTEHAADDCFLIGCPDHGCAVMRHRPTSQQSRRIRKKAVRP